MNEQNRNIILISVDTLKSKGFLDDNVDNASITIINKTVQDMLLETILGTQCYLQLLTQSANDKIDDAYKYILDNYILYIIGYAVKGEALVEMTYQLKNKGAVISQGQTYQVASLSDIKFVKESYDQKVREYSQRLNDYMFAHRTDFPEYNIKLSQEEYGTSQNSVAMLSGIYLKKGYRK